MEEYETLPLRAEEELGVSATSDDSTHPDDEQEDLVALGKKQRPITCVFNFVNSSLGSGVLTIPFNLSVAGWGLGGILTAAFALLSALSFYMLIQTANMSHRFQYDTVSAKIFPRWVGYLSVAASMLFTAGCVVSYVIVIRDNFFFFAEDDRLWTNLTLCGIMFLLILPLCFLPSLDALKFNSVLILVVIGYILFTVVYTFLDHCAAGSAPAASVVAFNWSPAAIQALPLTIQAYNSQYNFLNLYRELHSRKKNGMRVVWGNVGIITAIYAAIGAFGYLTYGDATESNILKNLAREGSVLAKVANVGMIVLMVCHYPLPVYSFRKAIESVAFHTEEYDRRWVSNLISAGIVVAATVVGIFLKSIDNVLDFTSSLAGGTLGFIMPGLFYYKIGSLEERRGQQAVGLALAVAGALITLVGFAMACYKWIVLPLSE